MNKIRSNASNLCKQRARKRKRRERKIRRRRSVVERMGLKCEPGGGRNRRDRRNPETAVVHNYPQSY